MVDDGKMHEYIEEDIKEVYNYTKRRVKEGGGVASIEKVISNKATTIGNYPLCILTIKLSTL